MIKSLLKNKCIHFLSFHYVFDKKPVKKLSKKLVDSYLRKKNSMKNESL